MRSPAAGSTLAVLVYCALSVVAFLPYGPFDSSNLLATSPHDSVDVGWFMAYAAQAVTHLLNPFYTKYLEYPVGVNIPANQSMPLLGWLMFPVTKLAGAFGMMSFTMRLSFAASAVSAYFCLRRVCRRQLPAFLGGLFFGFNPFMVAHNLENQNFTFLPVLPIAFLLLYRLLSGESSRPRRDGSWLGVLCAIQLYLNPEPLAELLVVAVLVVIGVLAVRAVRRRLVRAELLAFLGGAGWALLALVVLGAPFAYYYLFGPQHVGGSLVGPQYLAVFHTDLAQLVLPDHNQLIGSASYCPGAGTCPAPQYWNTFSGGALNETGSYLGVPLLLGLGWLAVRYRRLRLVAWSTASILVGFVLSLGPSLYVYNRNTNIWMPASIGLHLPVLDNAETIRYFLVADLAVAFLLAVGLDRLLAEERGPVSRLAGQRAWLRTGAVALFAGVLLFPLIPRWPYPETPTAVPAYFTTKAVDAIRPGAVVLAYPIPQSGAVQGMTWQMASNFRFKLVSGYAYVADNGGVPEGNPPFEWATLPSLMNVASGNDTTDKIPALSVQAVEWIRADLAQFGVDDILLDPTVGSPSDVAVVEHDLSVTLGERPVPSGGILAYYGVRRAIRQPVSSLLAHDREAGILKGYLPAGP